MKSSQPARSRAWTNLRVFRKQVRHGRRRTRYQAFRRTETARIHARAILADPRILILDEATPAWTPNRKRSFRWAAVPDARADDIRHRASAFDHPPSRSNPRCGSRQNHRARESSIALYAGGRYYDFTPSSTLSKQISFLLPVKARSKVTIRGREASAGNGRGSRDLPDAIRLIRGQATESGFIPKRKSAAEARLFIPL